MPWKNGKSKGKDVGFSEAEPLYHFLVFVGTNYLIILLFLFMEVSVEKYIWLDFFLKAKKKKKKKNSLFL